MAGYPHDLLPVGGIRSVRLRTVLARLLLSVGVSVFPGDLRLTCPPDPAVHVVPSDPAAPAPAPAPHAQRQGQVGRRQPALLRQGLGLGGLGPGARASVLLLSPWSISKHHLFREDLTTFYCCCRSYQAS